MHHRPIFLVTRINEAKRRAPSSYYTGGDEKQALTVVRFVHGFFPGIGMKFFFPDKHEATVHFAPWEVYTPLKLIQAMQPTNAPFEVVAITKTKYDGEGKLEFPGMPPMSDQEDSVTPNFPPQFEWQHRYPEGMKAPKRRAAPSHKARRNEPKPKKPSWEVDLVDHRSERQIALRFPTEGQARRYAAGRSYTIQDMFGTLPASPIDVEDELQARADEARAKVEEAHYLIAQATGSQYSQDLAEGAALAATQAAAAAAAHTTYLGQPDDQHINFWIANGGSAGWYIVGTDRQISGIGSTGWVSNAYFVYYTRAQLVASGYVHYAEGTFSHPANGILVGDFESDVSVAAGHVI